MAVLLPLRPPPLAETRQQYLVVVPTAAEELTLAPPLDPIPGVLIVLDAALVIRVGTRANLPQVQRLESVVQQKQLRFGAVSLFPIRLRDPRTGRCDAIDPVNPMEGGRTDRSAVAQADREYDVTVLAGMVEVLFFTDHSDR